MKSNGSIFSGIIINILLLIIIYIIPFSLLHSVIKPSSFFSYLPLILLFVIVVIILRIIVSKIYKRMITRKISQVDQTINQIRGFNSRPVWGGIWGKLYLSEEKEQLRNLKLAVKLAEKNDGNVDELKSMTDQIPSRKISGSSIFEALYCSSRVLNKSL